MVNEPLIKTHCLFVIDNSSKLKFLIDTASDLSVFLRRLANGWKEKSKYVLFAVNSQPINTYGPIHLNLNLRRDFVWRFIIADVDTPIIGADFLNHYVLLVDLRNSCLQDNLTNITTNGFYVKSTVIHQVKTINQDNKYYKILQEYPCLTRHGICKEVKHKTTHHIVTKPGPISCKARR